MNIVKLFANLLVSIGMTSCLLTSCEQITEFFSIESNSEVCDSVSDVVMCLYPGDEPLCF